ncbi:MAG: hypothetical protein NVSMB4_07010 [Acidimicrobiales bacterium]
MTDPWPPSPWMSSPQVAAYSGCGKDTVLRALQSGDLVGRQRTAPNGRWHVHRDDVDRWLRGETPRRALRSA